MRCLLLLCAALLAACTHLKGVVLEDPTQRPMRTAVLSIGRPTGIAVYGTHQVDQNGRFDFYLGPTDDNNIFLYDGAASPELTMRRIETYEMSDHMALHLRPASPGSPMLPAGSLINP